jgi:glycosyltransferase 2 family protein
MKDSSSRVPKLSPWQLAWSALASVVFVPLAFRGVSLPEVGRILREAHWAPIVLAALLFSITVMAKAARWGLFFQRRLSFRSLFAAAAIAQSVNFLLPGRLGEVARVYVLRHREEDRVARILGTIGAEKFVDLIALVVLAVIVTPFIPLPAWLRDPSLRVSAVSLGATLMLAVVYLQRARLRRLATWAAVRVFRSNPTVIGKQIDLTVDGFAPLADRKAIPAIAAASVGIWWLMVATNYALFFALPMRPSWLVAAVLLLVLHVGVAVPSTPGKIGVFQMLVNITLALFGVSRELALGYGLLLYLIIVLPQAAMAAPFVGEELAALRRQQPEAAGAVD